MAGETGRVDRPDDNQFKRVFGLQIMRIMRRLNDYDMYLTTISLPAANGCASLFRSGIDERQSNCSLPRQIIE